MFKDVIEEGYNDNAQKRNARARELRKQGWKVTCKKWDLRDLGRGARYTLRAERSNVEEVL